MIYPPLSVGTDIEEIDRFAPYLPDSRLLHRCFTQEERSYAGSKGRGAAASYAAMYCAKEAFGKAVGTGVTVRSLREIEVVHKPSGQPEFLLHGKTARLFGHLTLSLSLSHTKHYATATVVCLGDLTQALQALDEHQEEVAQDADS